MKSIAKEKNQVYAAQEAPQSRETTRLLRIREVLKRYPVSRAAWYAGMRDGRLPASVSIGPKSVAWRESDIDSLIASAK